MFRLPVLCSTCLLACRLAPTWSSPTLSAATIRTWSNAPSTPRFLWHLWALSSSHWARSLPSPCSPRSTFPPKPCRSLRSTYASFCSACPRFCSTTLRPRFSAPSASPACRCKRLPCPPSSTLAWTSSLSPYSTGASRASPSPPPSPTPSVPLRSLSACSRPTPSSASPHATWLSTPSPSSASSRSACPPASKAPSLPSPTSSFSLPSTAWAPRSWQPRAPP